MQMPGQILFPTKVAAMRREYLSVLKGDWFLLALTVLLGLMVTGSSPAVGLGAQGETAVSPDATPEVWQVKPNQTPAGSDVTFQVEGRNFAEGVRAESESTEKVKITSVRRVSDSKLEVKAAISGQAAVGDAGFYVRNPKGHGSGYGGFGITAAQAPSPAPTAEVGPSAPATPGKTTVPATTQETGGAATKFEVFNLGEGINLLQNPNKSKGVLSVAGGKLKYEEGGKEVFSLAPSEIKEIDANSILGYNTGTIHVILNSGPTYNFAPASLSMTDGPKMLDGLKRALH
jgi:hypothetical protein